MKTTVSSKGQFVLPAEFRRKDRVLPGEQFDVVRIGRGKYQLSRRKSPPSQGLVNWLLACPVKGYFVPVPSQSTDTIRPPV